VRKIIHVDMDAFYASVEQRDDLQLRGKPVIVACRGNRSVVCAASYEARRFGVNSAMPAVRAKRLCPDAIFAPPDFTRYRAVSRSVREISKRHTDLIEQTYPVRVAPKWKRSPIGGAVNSLGETLAPDWAGDICAYGVTTEGQNRAVGGATSENPDRASNAR
jgi:hypothetical protein